MVSICELIVSLPTSYLLNNNNNNKLLNGKNEMTDNVACDIGVK
jgi:hypothetical protein